MSPKKRNTRPEARTGFSPRAGVLAGSTVLIQVFLPLMKTGVGGCCWGREPRNNFDEQPATRTIILLGFSPSEDHIRWTLELLYWPHVCGRHVALWGEGVNILWHTSPFIQNINHFKRIYNRSSGSTKTSNDNGRERIFERRFSSNAE